MMARSRMIRPEFWDDEKLSKISRDARLTFIGIWNHSDDYGVVKGNHRWLKNKIFPYNNIKDNIFDGWVKLLIKMNALIPFSDNGEAFYFIKNFLKHQKVNRPSKQRNPEPPQQILEDSLNAHGVLIDETETETETEDKQKPRGIDYPDWLNMDLWKEFKKHRTLIKSPMSEHAEKLCLADLKKLVAEGEDQDVCINATIKSGKWKSFYTVKDKNKDTDSTKSDLYKYTKCNHCGASASNVKSGKECPFCGEMVNG